ncbi:MAG: GNAT family N-acetyltransferase [Pseudomonadota bacterium]
MPTSDDATVFDRQPCLDGDSVALRPLRAADFEALYTVAADPEIWAQHPASNRHELAVFRSFFDNAMASGGALVAIDSAKQQIIGSSRYHGWDAARREIEIGWTFLARDYWGGRYNGEMKRLMLRHAFQFVDHVLFRIGVTNIRSQRAAEKIGASRIGASTDASGIESYVYRLSAQ